MSRPLVGTRLGKYLLIEAIGRGAMGVVFKACHEELAKTVALKVMSRPDLEGSASAFDRFQIEARAAARLSHPNIVSVLDAGAADGFHYFTMEYVEGETLEARLSRGCLDPMEAARIGEQIANALAHAHTHGVVHRDVKPQNILLTPDAGAKLADFGLAKDVRAERGPTLMGQVLGTPHYMSPEQAGGIVGEIDGRSDLFSLGAVLYECVTGRTPFRGSSVAEVIDQIRAREPQPMRFHSAVLSPEFEAIVFQCMEKDKRRRYQRAEDLVDDLQRFRRGEMVLARRQTFFFRLRRRARKNWRIASFVVAVLLLAAGAVAFFQRQTWRQQAAVTRKDEILQLVQEAQELSRAREVSSVPEVIARCDRAVADAPTRETRTWIAQAFYLRALAHRRLLHLPQAKSDLAQAISIDSSRNDARYEEALVEIDLGDNEAEDHLRQVIQHGAEDSILCLLARTRLALLQSRKRETSPQLASDLHAEVDLCLDEAQKKDPLFADQYLLRAALVGWSAGYGTGLPQPPVRRPDLVLAMKYLDQALMLDPLSVPGRLARGENLRRLERYQEAVKDFSLAAELAPDDPLVFFLRARTYSALRLYDFSLADLQQAIRLRRVDDLLVYRGIVRTCLGDSAGALRDAQEAYTLARGNPENMFFLALCLSLTGEEMRSQELARAWAKGNSRFFHEAAAIDRLMMSPLLARLTGPVMKSMAAGIDNYFGVEPSIQESTRLAMWELVARRSPSDTSVLGLRQLKERLGDPGDLLPPELDDMLLRIDESDPMQQGLLRAANLVLRAVGIHTPLQTLVQLARFQTRLRNLLSLEDRAELMDPREMYQRGCLRFFRGDRDSLLAARADFRKALEARPSFPEALYGLASTAARLHFSDECLDALRRLKRSGFAHWQGVKDDPDLSTMREDSEIKKLFQD